jgi:primosomal protein N' (replication factor Y)
MACHHCGHRERVPDRCDACGSTSVARHGAGTERIEHELRDGLDVPVFRLDAGHRGAKDAVPELLAPLPRRAGGLLLGTQMVAKGTTSPTSRSASCSTPTARCASPTSAPRSARSR